MRPLVGIVAHRHVVPKFFGDLPVEGTPQWYVDAVVAAGGRAVLLPGAEAAGLVDVVDALVLTGGSDLSAEVGGCDPALLVEPAPERDRDELALVRAAEAARTPLLAVCRGLQLLAVADGGRLVPDLGMAHVLPGTGHRVTTRPGSGIAGLLGPCAHVTSLHHQAVADPGPRWVATAWADDGTIEAIEPVGDWPVLAVQWHPERFEDETGPALFGWLVTQASYAGAGVPA